MDERVYGSVRAFPGENNITESVQTTALMASCPRGAVVSLFSLTPHCQPCP